MVYHVYLLKMVDLSMAMLNNQMVDQMMNHQWSDMVISHKS